VAVFLDSCLRRNDTWNKRIYGATHYFLGENIRKRRLDPGLLQVEITAEISVTESTA
jgi:hypothetical protein